MKASSPSLKRSEKLSKVFCFFFSKKKAFLLLTLIAAAPCSAAPLRVVAAENFYGDIARQVGGDDVSVTSILANPDQDPHLFELSPSVARAVSDAGFVIENGLDYDPWMDRLVATARVPADRVIVVASLLGRRAGSTPHVWYDPATMPALAHALAAAFTANDPAHATGYAQRLARFDAAMAPLLAKVAVLRNRFRGTQVTATEPVFDCMIAALGMVSRNRHFQLAVMNETEASASDVARFEDDLRAHRVGLLIVNRQASNAVADRLKRIALMAGVPVVGASELEPAGVSYQDWMSAELDMLEKAMAGPIR